MASSKEWANFISSIASFMYFLLIIFQIPLFRVPCRFGMCKTPIEVTTSQLMASELFPTYVVKVLLYPGAVANAIIKRRTLPRYSKLLKLYNISALRKSTAVSDLQRLEILAGSYLSVVGAFIGLSRRARMSLFGTMLIIWSLVRDIVLGQFHNMFPTKSIQMYPTLILAVVCAFLSIKKDFSAYQFLKAGNFVLRTRSCDGFYMAFSNEVSFDTLPVEMFNTSLQMSLNCPSHLSVSVTRQRNVCKRVLNPVLAMPPSSVILHTDESGEFPESRNSSSSSNASLSSCAGSLLCHPNTVGIMGGGSVDSTLSFVRKLVHWSKENEETCMPFVLCSDPVLNRELLSLERNSSSLCSRNARSQFDHSPIVENLLSKRVFLEKSGAQCIVVPCHISHSWHDEVFKGCSIPSLHMAECVSRELKEAKLKPLEAGSPLRIGVLATDATLKAGFYQEKLQNEVNSFLIVCPEK
ncbi:hypothetical protein Golob_003666 [Gossypium lobatum]|uniref:Uncharacterized protein n=1 Tax=Gossypium lobatum TaxID=34289 RepID=A0A7J8MZ93_9ROSI|nr:hypothetical protein [Gossypium lobatum]